MIPARVPETEFVDLMAAADRVLAEDLAADRDYPPTARSVRDGFAVRAGNLPGRLEVIGEVRAGETYRGQVHPGQAVEIMTGAPLPDGADQVIMVEHVKREGSHITANVPPHPGDNVSAQGIEAAAGQRVLCAGQRLGFAQIAQLAAVGVIKVPVFIRPRVAILATGDEVVPVDTTPRANQVRNSNAYSLAVQVQRAGGIPVMLQTAHDTAESTRAMMRQGLEADLLLISGGVSAGKYDLVETILTEFEAKFFFTRVKVQPGQPLVFGRCVNGDGAERFFFGLPGNPSSTMVTFELFARAAIEVLSGELTPMLPLLTAALTAAITQKSGLTRVLPAMLSPDGAAVTPIHWKGSGDVPSLARANCFTVSDPGRETYAAGDFIRVMRQ